jgi:uncharacterized protein (TIGR02444 family)
MARNPFWIYSLRLYKHPGVAVSCLALQDRAGVDVNLLLFCLWCGSRSVALRATTMKTAISASQRWSDSVVQPLRTVRRDLKQPASSSKSIRLLRQRIAAVELQAERLQQDSLYALVRNAAPTTGDPVTQAAGNVAAYLRQAGIGLTPRDWVALKTIVRAAF